MSLFTKLTRLFSFIPNQSVGFWIRILSFVTAGVLIGFFLEEVPQTEAVRSYSYRMLSQIVSRHHGPRYTAIVAIHDEEYWKDPELAHRVPINRSYLANLLRKVDDADPAVIAIDFDFSSPLPEEKQREDPNYASETKDLNDALSIVSKHRPVILPTTMGTDAHGKYVLESNIYDISNGNNALCHENQPCRGYIALPFSPELLPPEVKLADGCKLNSLSGASVVAYDDTFIPRGEYVDFIEAARFDPVTFTASDLIQNPEHYKSKLHSRIVLLGGIWHSRAYRRGPLIDLHYTPIGSMPGVLLHANYIESMLGEHSLAGLSAWIRLPFEWMVTFVVAVLLQLPKIRQWDWMLVPVGIFFLGIAYALFRSIGIFFEFVIPSIFIFGHYILEKVVHWRELARKYEAEHPSH